MFRSQSSAPRAGEFSHTWQWYPLPTGSDEAFSRVVRSRFRTRRAASRTSSGREALRGAAGAIMLVNAMLYCPSDVHFDPVVHRSESVRGAVGFAPRDLHRSLMSRQSLLQSGPNCDVCASFRALCELVFARRHILAVIVNVRPADDDQTVGVFKTGEQVKRRAQTG